MAVEVIEDYLIDKILVDREIRQRTNVKDLEALAASIDRDGQIHPITIKRDGTLVAGERRLAACKLNGYATVRVQIFETLSPTDAYRIELQENIARKNLPWQDECRAVFIYHEMRMQVTNNEWTVQATAEDLGVSQGTVYAKLAVAKYLADEEVMSCQTLDGALNLIKGRAERAQAAATSRGLEVANAAVQQTKINKNLSKEDKGKALLGLFGKPEAEAPEVDIMSTIEAGEIAAASLREHEAKQVAKIAQPIITASFLDWAPTYDGPPFDVLHVDFPYGKEYKGSNTRKTGRAHICPTYTDSPDIMWELLEALLTWQDALAYPTAHMVFWFDMSFYTGLIETITNAGWKLVQPFPLIWHKPYQGVASDTKRRPRHTYETALLFSRGDRKLVKLDEDVFSGRVEEKLHLNQKSDEMLTKFLAMLVDQNTAVLDPTCGSGSALAVARRLGSPRVLGIELDEDNADVARFVLQRDVEMEEETENA